MRHSGSISTRTDVYVTSLMTDIEQETKLEIGTELCVPILASVFRSATSPRFCVIHAGDTLLTISKKRGILLKDLEVWNPHVKEGFALPGERILLEPPKEL